MRWGEGDAEFVRPVHWLVVLHGAVVIFLPHGMGGLRIFRAESSPGQVITKERFLPRNRDTMVWLWGIYLGLNLLQVLLMCLGGMSLFDSLCHAFGTVSTSGYSPYNASVGHYGSAYFDWIIILFMFLGGMTFMLFFHMLRGNWTALRILGRSVIAGSRCAVQCTPFRIRSRL